MGDASFQRFFWKKAANLTFRAIETKNIGCSRNLADFGGVL